MCVMVGMSMVNSVKHGFPPPCHISDFPLRLMDSMVGVVGLEDGALRGAIVCNNDS